MLAGLVFTIAWALNEWPGHGCVWMRIGLVGLPLGLPLLLWGIDKMEGKKRSRHIASLALLLMTAVLAVGVAYCGCAEQYVRYGLILLGGYLILLGWIKLLQLTRMTLDAP